MSILKYKNKSGQGYVISELGPEIKLGNSVFKKGLAIPADPDIEFSINSEDIFKSELLSNLINSGALENVIENNFLEEKFEQIKNSDQVIFPLNQLEDQHFIYEENIKEMKPDPHPLASPPRNILVDEPNRTSPLVDGDQYKHIKSIYEEATDVKKKE